MCSFGRFGRYVRILNSCRTEGHGVNYEVYFVTLLFLCIKKRGEVGGLG